MCGAGGGDNGVGEGGEKLGAEQVGGDRGRAGIEFDACELYFGMGLAFLTIGWFLHQSKFLHWIS